MLLSITNLKTENNEINASCINDVVSKIEQLFLNCAKNTFGVKKKLNEKGNKNKHWFNLNFKMARNEYRVIRRMHNENKTIENRNLLKIVSKRYKTVMKQSINRFKTERINKLKNLKNAKPKEFWKIINSADKKKKECNFRPHWKTYTT